MCTSVGKQGIVRHVESKTAPSHTCTLLPLLCTMCLPLRGLPGSSCCCAAANAAGCAAALAKLCLLLWLLAGRPAMGP
jgi:hypothetical protein